jgi:hypothetical protein
VKERERERERDRERERGRGERHYPLTFLSSPLLAVRARMVINCAGNFGDRMEKLRAPHQSPSFQITPRKGQFVVYDTREEKQLRTLVLPVRGREQEGRRERRKRKKRRRECEKTEKTQRK